MTKFLIGIAAISSALALAVSLPAAAAAQSDGNAEHDSRRVNKRSLLFEINRDILEQDALINYRFPLMRPQPTKIAPSARYGLG